jgi:ubiquinol-cytochrome c reductase cytochrome c1 subunit
MRNTVFAAAVLAAVSGSAMAAEMPKAPNQDWSFDGLFGTFDRASTQRGFQVYKQVCSSCHSLQFVAYRNLEALGFTPDQVQAIASEYEVQDCCTDDGEPFDRPAKPSDRFVSPFPNVQAARSANNGALPPDLSLIAKARVGGPDYLFALLTGYQEEPPEGVELMEGMHYNSYFPGHQIAMAQPLWGDDVEFADGTEATIEQQAKDVTSFLAWAASPELEARKRMGVKVLLFLIVFTGMLYAVKRKIWSDQH